ncbi:MAG: dienelactone hydrolase family protein [Gemmatimonadales bacterium]
MTRQMLLAAAGAIALAGCGKAESGQSEAAAPKVETREVEYQLNGETLKGFMAWDANATDKRPGVVVVHEWWGHNEHARNQARRLAEAGYPAFALDMYGNGQSTQHPDTAQALMMAAMSDPAKLVARFTAALEQLRQDPHVDPERIAAIGYCFGGAVVLSMARAGTDLDAVASFHGALAGLTPADSGNVKARILVMTGAADPFVPAEQVEAFRQEMTSAGAGDRTTIISYPGAKHGFTNPDAASFGMDALAYDATADQQSWAEMLKMFGEVFGR